MLYRKYTLEKYHGKNSRTTCPKCEKPNVFVKYVDENNIPLAEDVGRCNRESKCGYHYTPRMWYTDHPLAQKAKPDKLRRYNWYSTKTAPISFIDWHWTQDYYNPHNNLFWFLRTILTPSQVQNIQYYYNIGSTKKGEIIYWQIDSNGQVRTGKIMQYDKFTGKRLKGVGAINWVHSKLSNLKKADNPFNLTQCLFGERLVTWYPDKDIAVVESEKTACIMSALIDDVIWLATGGKSNMNADKLKIIKNRNVTFYPDYDGYKEWQKKLTQINKNKNWRVSDLILRLYPETNSNEKITFDLADIAITELKFGTPKRLTEKIIEDLGAKI